MYLTVDVSETKCFGVVWYIYYILFIHRLTDVWVVCTFWLLWIILLWTLVYWHPFRSLLSLLPPRNGIAGSYGNSMFNFLRNHHTVFHNSCTILHSQCTRVPISRCPHQRLLFSVLITAILMDVRWSLTVVLIWLVMLSIFLCFLAICVSPLENVYSGPLPIYELGCLFFVVEL